MLRLLKIYWFFVSKLYSKGIHSKCSALLIFAIAPSYDKLIYVSIYQHVQNLLQQVFILALFRGHFSVNPFIQFVY